MKNKSEEEKFARSSGGPEVDQRLPSGTRSYREGGLGGGVCYREGSTNYREGNLCYHGDNLYYHVPRLTTKPLFVDFSNSNSNSFSSTTTTYLGPTINFFPTLFFFAYFNKIDSTFFPGGINLSIYGKKSSNSHSLANLNNSLIRE